MREKIMSPGDKHTTRDGVTVTVAEYLYASRVVVEDEHGNRRELDAKLLRTTGITWLNKDGTLRGHKARQTIVLPPLAVGRTYRNPEGLSARILALDGNAKLADVLWIKAARVERGLPYSTFRDCELLPKQVKKDPINPAGYYVYVVSVLGEGTVYVGSGKGDRMRHAVSGCSHNHYLNRLHFLDRPLIVEVYRQDMTKVESLKLERQLIADWQPLANFNLSTS